MPNHQASDVNSVKILIDENLLNKEITINFATNRNITMFVLFSFTFWLAGYIYLLLLAVYIKK